MIVSFVEHCRIHFLPLANPYPSLPLLWPQQVGACHGKRGVVKSGMLLLSREEASSSSNSQCCLNHDDRVLGLSSTLTPLTA